MRSRAGALERLIRTTQDAVVFIDARARIVEFNRAAQEMFEYSPGEVIGRNVSVLMPEPFRKEHDAYIERYERTGEARAIGSIRSVRGRRKTGEEFPIELSITELPGDELVRYAAFLRDISDKVALQDQIVDQERLATLGTAAAMLAHEIGNPLNNLYMVAQLLQRQLRKRRDEEAYGGRVGILLDEIRRLTRILEEFRSISRKHVVVGRPCSLGELARYAASQAAQLGGEKVEVRTEVGASDCIVTGDLDKLKQVVLNLAKNAVEAMPEGGSMTLTVECTSEQAILRIADTGPGLPTDCDVFEPFQTTKADGNGLGLPIVKQIVSAHRGSISWESTTGEGTTFIISFPRPKS